MDQLDKRIRMIGRALAEALTTGSGKDLSVPKKTSACLAVERYPGLNNELAVGRLLFYVSSLPNFHKWFTNICDLYGITAYELAAEEDMRGTGLYSIDTYVAIAGMLLAAGCILVNYKAFSACIAYIKERKGYDTAFAVFIVGHASVLRELR